jgi:hypothetical protein
MSKELIHVTDRVGSGRRNQHDIPIHRVALLQRESWL